MEFFGAGCADRLYYRDDFHGADAQHSHDRCRSRDPCHRLPAQAAASLRLRLNRDTLSRIIVAQGVYFGLASIQDFFPRVSSLSYFLSGGASQMTLLPGSQIGCGDIMFPGFGSLGFSKASARLQCASASD